MDYVKKTKEKDKTLLSYQILSLFWDFSLFVLRSNNLQ